MYYIFFNIKNYSYLLNKIYCYLDALNRPFVTFMCFEEEMYF